MADAAGRRWFWDGTQWRPVMATTPARSYRWLLGPLVFAVLLGAYFLFGNHPAQTQTISNAKIDSPTQVEFDYHASSSCSNLTFSYTFYDSGGKAVDAWDGEASHSVTAGRDYHITASADPVSGQAIDSAATRFDVTPTCHAR
jgi:hypothetical protein